VVLGGYVGRYQFSAEVGGTASVTRDGGHLYIQQGSIPRSELFATADGQFFSLLSCGLIGFHRDATGHADSFIFHAGGKDLSATRIE
jgi:hypothetical protein